MTSTQIADSAKFGATHFAATDTVEHEAAFAAAIKRSQTQGAQYAALQASSARHTAMLDQINAAFSA
jgi:hypothetical protein